MPELRFSTVRLTTGPRIHYAEQGDARGEPILFARLAGFLVFVQPGDAAPRPAFMRSSWTSAASAIRSKPDAGYGIDELRSDAMAFLDAVSVERATVVGHSFGSFVTRHRRPRPSRDESLASS